MSPRPIEIVKHCCLVGSLLERADLRYKDLRGVNFSNSNLRGADFTKADCRGAIFIKADLSRACLYQADFEGADFSNADMTGAYMRASNFSYARMWFTSMRRVTAKRCFFLGADMTGVDFAYGFFLGSRFGPPVADTKVARNLDKAVFHWYWNPGGGPPSYDPKDGYVEIWDTVTAGFSFTENAGAILDLESEYE